MIKTGIADQIISFIDCEYERQIKDKALDLILYFDGSTVYPINRFR